MNVLEKVKTLNIDALINILTVKYSDNILSDYRMITKLLNSNFNLKLTEDDIINYYLVSIEQQDRQLHLKHFGYDITI